MDWAITFFSMETTDVQLMTIMKITPFTKTIFFQDLRTLSFCVLYLLVLLVLMHLFLCNLPLILNN